MRTKALLLATAMAFAGTIGAAAQGAPGDSGPGMMRGDADLGREMMQGGDDQTGRGMMRDGSARSDDDATMQGHAGMRERHMRRMMEGGMGNTGGSPCGMSEGTRDGMMHQGRSGRMMMGQGMMGRGRDGQGMMGHPMMDRGTMGPGMRADGARPGMGAVFGTRVRPVMSISADDVRAYLDLRLKRLANKRLKLGDIKPADDDTITADIVTVDNSLVQRLKVDRHTGAIDYED